MQGEVPASSIALPRDHSHRLNLAANIWSLRIGIELHTHEDIIHGGLTSGNFLFLKAHLGYTVDYSRDSEFSEELILQNGHL